MGFVNAAHAAGANEEIFVSVGHANDFVGNNLPDRNDEVMSAIPDQFVELSRPGFGPDAVGDFAHVVGGDFAYGYHVISPAVRADQIVGDSGKHFIELMGGHGNVSAESRQDVLEVVSVVSENFRSKEAGPGVEASEIGRDGEDFFARPNVVQGGAQSGTEVIISEVGGGRTLRKEEHAGSFKLRRGGTKEKEGDDCEESLDEGRVILGGVSTGFHENGEKKFKASYKAGSLHGNLIEYEEDGSVGRSRLFREGEVVEKEAG